ncbi:T9SS-dependent choice-of-anchor J family protein [Flavobacterium sp. MK4S-17]|uniref:T9SS-dependent choice-of-anchor J family protein n=1 Tax=Flavobacterium sp. MK4S-17 TaxID=2543737 RepID=UPI00135CC872|nr:T9SS type A sorting domain-containing protein [Flavobacterium sp. MK4S-17]
MQKLNNLFVVLAFIGATLNLHAQTTILDETLLTQESFTTFTPVSVTGYQNWYFSSSYGAVCSGYSGGQSYENEDWLVSPVMNLSEVDNAQLSFSHARGNAAVMNVGVEQGWYKVYATAAYTGDPLTTQWIELQGVNQNITSAWQYISSGNITIPQAAKSQNSRIAFRYISSASQSATWEIKNVKVTGDYQGTNPGSGGVFKITNWNTEWLGCDTFGPSNENQQINNVVSAMLTMNADIYCLQEVSNTVSSPSIATIVSLLGSDEWGGSIVPSNTGDCNQRQGIIYKKSRVQFVSAMELNNGNAALGNSYYYNWSSGRFPALYNVNLISGNASVPLTIINIHAKAEDNEAMSHTRRAGASQALKTILDGTNYNTKNLVIVGDFNDYLIGTNNYACNCGVSPYKNFMDDTSNYSGITKYINDVDTSWGVRPLIEHFIISNELADNYISNSAKQEITIPQTISNYYNTTSGHLPVSATFEFSTLSNTKNPDFVDHWSIYPNPVKDILNIENMDITYNNTIEIYDLTGRQIMAKNLTEDKVNVSAFPAGVYILKIGNRSKKFIKE